ncbi:hypothetical protein RDABS01_033451 [Bienertia sinuspersici]
MESTTLTPPTARQEAYIRWIAPLTNWFALNTDGAAKGTPGLTGRGGIIHNSNGWYVVAFAVNLGICSAFKAELRAAIHGLHLAKELGLNKIILQMDNQSCIQALQSEELICFSHDPPELLPLLRNDVTGVALPRMLRL